jgi:hypothetical protein
MPTLDQLIAIQQWARIHGRTWKYDLRQAWMTGDYGCNQDIAPPLQQLRNSLGPSWLVRFRLEK